MLCRWLLLHSDLMGKYRGGLKPWEKDDPQGRRLDPGQYPELNAVFYTADPAEFIKLRIEALSLMACSDEQLAPVFGADRVMSSDPDTLVRWHHHRVRRGSGTSVDRGSVRGIEIDGRERFRGCLLGGAVGDALGAPVEFHTREQILARFGPDGITACMLSRPLIATITPANLAGTDGSAVLP